MSLWGTHALTHTPPAPRVIIVQWPWSACCHLYPIKNILTSAHTRTHPKSFFPLFQKHSLAHTLSSSPLTRPPLLSTICPTIPHLLYCPFFALWFGAFPLCYFCSIGKTLIATALQHLSRPFCTFAYHTIFPIDSKWW